MNKFIDLLYYTGFGFKDELNLTEKLKRRDINAASVVNYHKLRPAERVTEFLQANSKQ